MDQPPATADICDAHDVDVAEPIFRDFGKRRAFGGEIATVKVFEDNVLVKEALAEPGRGRVLVVDGGGSTRHALLGDRVATLARDQGWAGVIVYGAVRDSAELGDIEVGIKAVTTCPRRSEKHGHGQRDVSVTFAGVTFRPGAWVYADHDGVVSSPEALV